MRTKTLIDGFKNSQKLRVIINGVALYTTIKGVMFDVFGYGEQRSAVCDALFALRSHRSAGEPAVGLTGAWRGYSVQVDLL